MKPPAVRCSFMYHLHPPPEPSPRLTWWLKLLEHGRWQPNNRIRGLGYSEKAEFYGVYVWEYLHVLAPKLKEHERERNREYRQR